MVRASSLEAAHDLAHAVWGALFLGTLHTFEPAPLLLEIAEEPTASWEFGEILASLKIPRSLVQYTSSNLETGSVLSELDLKYLPFGLRAISSKPHLAAALRQLNLSRVLVPDLLEPFDFESMSSDDLQADYLSHRAHYELAFLAAFKGVEGILGGGQLKKSTIADKLNALRFAVTAARDDEKNAAIVASFLDARNAAAAHSNATPPKNLRVTLDRVLGLQRFLLELCGRVSGRFEETALPGDAYVRRL